MSACGFCGSEVQDTVICPRCVRVTDSDLERMPSLAVDVHTAMQRMVNMAEKNDGGKSAEIALAFNEKAAEVLHDMRGGLVGWCRLLWDEKQVPLPDRNTIAAISGHVRDNLTILASHAAAGDLVDEVAKMVRSAFDVIDSPTLRMFVELGPCVEIIGNDPCTGTVVARTYHDATVMGNWRCKRCLKEWQPTEWDKVGPQIVARRDAA